jgi:short-subunit dehydrogenase
MEEGDFIDISLMCPITVQTNFRENSLIKPKVKATESPKDTTITVDLAVDKIMEAADYRFPKLIFPFKPWLAV